MDRRADDVVRETKLKARPGKNCFYLLCFYEYLEADFHTLNSITLKI